MLVLAIVALAFAVGSRSFPTTVTVSTTRTVTVTSPSGAPVVIAEVIIQPEVINEVCLLQYRNATSTAYLVSVTSSTSNGGTGSFQATGTTTTVTLRAINTITLYYNVTYVDSTTTCTDINSHYHVTNTCPPCA